MVEEVKDNIGQIINACRKYHVKALYLFGSGARMNDFNNKSDLDFLVEFDYADETNDDNVFERVENRGLFQLSLENVTNGAVDLLQEKNINNKFLKYFINKEKKLVYGIS